MFANQTSIGRVVAHCAPSTERVQARLRISHLLQSADFTPRGFPPQAILIARHARVPESISLSSFRLRSEWESNVREQITDLYRSAVRPVRGIIPSNAPAVLFADTGEWLACMARAIHAGGIELAWYGRASSCEEVISSSLTLARAWANTPRFVPATIAHLAEWGCVAEVLQLFSRAEANAIFAAIAGEWNLPKRDWDFPERLNEPIDDRPRLSAPNGPADENGSSAVAGDSAGSQLPAGTTGLTGSEQRKISSSPEIDPDQQSEQALKPHWQPWWPALGKSCEGLPRESQRLLAVAFALLRAPARACSASFATELRRWLFAISERDEPAAPPAIRGESSAQSQVPRTLMTRPPIRTGSSTDTTARSAADTSTIATSGFQEHHSKTAESATGMVAEPASVSSGEASSSNASKIEIPPFWNPSGCETNLGGALFLINLIQQTGQPECFDEEFGLSEHLGGWGLVELLCKALLGPTIENFHDDPLWAILQHLDGRAQGEIPGATLPQIDEYRMPVEWLTRFVPLDEPWAIHTSPDRFRLCHRSGAFVLVDCPRRPLSIAQQAAMELERYRAHGIVATIAEGESPVDNSNSSSLQQIPDWKDLPSSMRRWMCWTFPFLNYLLMRALGDEADTRADLARLLLLKTGTLYCTATHIDLVMRMDQITLAVRRAGLDANPGWLPELRRVVSFHYE